METETSKVASAKIVRNRAQCSECGDIVESKYRHDYVSCKCGCIAVDGGLDYLKRSAVNLNNFVELSEWDTPETPTWEKYGAESPKFMLPLVPLFKAVWSLRTRQGRSDLLNIFRGFGRG